MVNMVHNLFKNMTLVINNCPVNHFEKWTKQ